MDGVAVGRVVHYVPASYESMYPGECRSAIITKVWSDDGTCQLSVFMDGSNDGPEYTPPSNVAWKTSKQFSETPEPGKWHWPERA